MPSIQGVMGKTSSSLINEKRKNKDKGWTKSGEADGKGSAGSGNSVKHREHEGEVSEVDFGKKRSLRGRKRATLELPVMTPPLPSTPRSAQNMSSYGQGQKRANSYDDTAPYMPVSAPVVPVGMDARGIISSATSHDHSHVNEHDMTDNDWDMVSLHPSPAYPQRTSSITHQHNPSHQTSRLNPSTTVNHIVDPEIGTLSSELDLRAVEVLEHLSSHLQNGWGDSILDQHRDSTSLSTGAVGSTRSWREMKKAKERGTIRPLSEQGWKRSGISGSSGSTSPPPVPQRHSSRPPPLPIELEGLAKKSLSIRRKEGKPGKGLKVSLVLAADVEDVTEKRRIL